MPNKMLIDASHPEETRVVVLHGNRVQEFDFEAADKKPLRGNIYLAKVTRVEPSLQAAFVDYGGNRHGFLAFAEIHPDYYQIPVADRIALLEEESRAHAQAEEEEPRAHQQNRGRRSRRRHHESAEKRAAREDGVIAGPLLDEEAVEAETPSAQAAGADFATEAVFIETSEAALPEAQETIADEAPETAAIEAHDAEPAASGDQAEAATAEPVVGAAADAVPTTNDAKLPKEASALDAAHHAAEAHEAITIDPSGYGILETGGPSDDEFAPMEQDHEAKARRQDERDEEALRRREETPDEDEDEEYEEHDDEAAHVEHIGGDAMEEVPYRAPRSRREYKIQEVIKRRQVLLVQVVKEERGNKGAALTTYLSLAGRFSVLMPNTARGGGISRKITDGADRKRLKEIVHELDVPEGMGVILRTAGATRTKQEVKRDFEYLLRMWESVRELTLRSSAPKLVYEEGSLIKRAIRDLYGQDVDEVLVSGAEAHREAQDFMRMLMPSHANQVKLYREPTPIFAEAGVEAQLDAMFSNKVTLKSGGYLVINQTEALVAIDVNSGRSTREHNIEDTALRTNLEAADEVARQLRLRDLAGLIVVDFIDMEESRNNRAVERRIKDALKNDRARIQVGRISHFGLLEMSRQRIRAGVVEGSTAPCPHCAGAGTVRSTASIALHVLRVLEEGLVRNSVFDVTLRTRAVVALYILNQKRPHLQNLEQRFGVHITVAADDTLTGANYHALERGEPASGARSPVSPRHLQVDSIRPEQLQEEPEEEEATSEAEGDIAETPRQDQPRSSRRNRGERFGGQRSQRTAPPRETVEPAEESEEIAGEPLFGGAEAEGDSEQAARSRRRRRRRGRGGGNGRGEEAALQPPAAGQDFEQPQVEADGAQPPDDALAFMANLEGQPTQSREGGRPPRGRGRGPGRWTRSSPLPPEYRESGLGAEAEAATPTAAEAPAENAPSDAAPSFDFDVPPTAPVERSEAPVVEPSRLAATPSAPEPSSAEPTTEVPGEAAHGSESEPAAAEPAEPSHAASKEVVITAADPSRPKKGGWWQRAKATLGDGE
jgi:ribonuclease E